MRRLIKKLGVFVLLFAMCGGIGLQADVKLRIYMRDGSLVAGNLVTENDIEFVVLSSDGRKAIPKNKIMFVNGKTLQQWEARPERNYQSEIIPSEIPKPSYVSDKEARPGVIQPYSSINSVIPEGDQVPSAPDSEPEPELEMSPTMVTESPRTEPPPPPIVQKDPEPPVKEAVAPEPEPVQQAQIPVAPPVEATSNASGISTSAGTTKDGFISQLMRRREPPPRPTPSPSPEKLTRKERKEMKKEAKRQEKEAKQKEKESMRDQEKTEMASVVPAPPMGSSGNKAIKPATKDTIKKQIKPQEKVTSLKKPSAPERRPHVEFDDTGLPNFPKRFTREGFSNAHYDRGQVLLLRGERGRAIQEFHYAQILNRRDERPALMLGKMYAQEGVYDRAEKYFDHPLIKKTEPVLKIKEEMASAQAKKARTPYVIAGEIAGGLLLGFVPLFVIRRRMAKKAIPRSMPAPILEPDQDSKWEQEFKDSPVLTEAASEKVDQPEPDLTGLPEEVQQIMESEPTISEFAEEASDRAAAESGPPGLEILAPEPLDRSVEKMPEGELSEGPALSEGSLEAPEESIEKPPVEEKVVRPLDPPKVESPVPDVPTPFPSPTFSVLPPAETPKEEVPPSSPPEPIIPEVNLPQPLEQNHREILARAKLVEMSIQRGNEYCEKGETGKAAREYRTVLALDPKRTEALIGLGYLSFMQGLWDMSMEYYVRALKIDPDSADAHYGIGRVFLETNHETEAAQQFEAALSLDPTFSDARDSLTYLGKAA